MATVFLAEDLKHRRPVAIKVLHAELAAVLGSERFLREIEVCARLTHPHILPLHDSGKAAGYLYYVMPYVEGESVRDLLDREGPLSLPVALRITREVADALSYAHGHGVIHRDIKPENILLESGHAVVADFGIARAIGSAGGDRVTGTGIVLGTPAYMSPEQATGSADVDGRSDIYAVGCMLYEMLAGRAPFLGPDAVSVVRQHLVVEPTRITTLRPDLPEGVAAALDRALAKNPAERYDRPAELVDALERAAAAGAHAAAAPGAAPATRRAGWPVLLGVAAVGALAATLLLLSGGPDEATPAEPLHPRSAIAVLPFQNLSPESTHAYFAGGLHDELLTQLSKVGALTVISRTSVLSYAGTQKPLRQIATELGVGSIVEGTVQVVGERLRVNVQLIDASSDAHLWADRYDRTLDDAFAIQSEVAQQVVAAVGAALSQAERQGLTEAPTTNPEAYRLYLQGHEYFTRPGGLQQDTETAQALYERALALDSRFALARAGLSEAHGWMYWNRYDPSPDRAARQRREAEAALRLAPDLPQGHKAMALAHYYGRRDYHAALEEFRVALRGLPNDARLWFSFAAVNRRLGNWDEVFAAVAKAMQLNPRDVEGLWDLGGNTYQGTRRYPEAVKAYDRALSLAPDLHPAAVRKGWAYVRWQGRFDSLRAILGRVPHGVGLGELGSEPAQRLQLFLWERQADSLLQALRQSRHAVYQGQRFFLPASLYAAWAHQLRGDEPAARAAFDSALVVLDSVVKELPDDHRVHAARGMALAGLGRRDEALDEARRLEQSDVYIRDAFAGSIVAEDRARILAHAGDAEAALEEIERLLRRPSWLSLHVLRLDPLWDPIRGHRRFQALVAEQDAR